VDLAKSIIGLRAMIRFSTKKLLFNRRWMVVALIALLVGAVMGYAALEGEDDIGIGVAYLDLLVLSFLLPIMSMIYGASMIRSEIDDRSITQVITSPVDRRVAYMGYYLSLIGVLALMMVTVNAVGWGSYFGLIGIDGEAMRVLLSISAVLTIGSVVYSSLFLVMGVALKQPVYLGLLYAFVWEGFVGSLPGAVGEYTIRHHLRVIASEWVNHADLANVPGDPLGSSIVLLAVTAVLLTAGMWAFREKEVP
jgi:ABC-type transport system involved in multi-copper enzyme maturation permease subunit